MLLRVEVEWQETTQKLILGDLEGFSNLASSSRTKQRHDNVSLQNILQHLEEGIVAQSWMVSDLDSRNKRGKLKMTHLEINAIIERKLAHQKIVFLTRYEVVKAADEWRDTINEKELDWEVEICHDLQH